VVSPLPAGLLPSDDWPVVELSVALAHWLTDEPLTGGLPGPRAANEPVSLPEEPEVDEPEVDEPEALARAGVFPAGFARRGQAQGAGFASGGTAELVPPGAVLAGLAHDAWDAGLDRLNDDQLIGVMLAWRRLGSLAAVAELDRRRQAQVAAGADAHLAEHVADEVAAALTLTAVGADRLVELADRLSRLPGRGRRWRPG
jgi:hypothetical protein